MRSVRSKDTKPELTVCRMVWAAGWRYRLHARDLPGKPDLVFRKQRKVIFIHGCFWHHHEGCKRATIPQTWTSFWTGKFAYNRQRDAANIRALNQTDWRALVVWECELKDVQRLAERVQRFLGEQPV